MEAKGSFLEPKGTLLDAKGSLLDPKGSLLEPKGSLLELKKVTFRPPRSILDRFGTGSANESRKVRMSHPEMVTFGSIWRSIGDILATKSDQKVIQNRYQKKVRFWNRNLMIFRDSVSVCNNKNLNIIL